MRNFGVLPLVMFFVFGWIFPVRAAEPSSADSGQVVISTSRMEESEDRAVTGVTVITAENIERSTAQNLPEILSLYAGLYVSDISGARRDYQVDLRGFGQGSQQNILLLIDDRVANLADQWGPDWNLVPLSQIERIEVVRGSRGNVIYGDYAVAGIVNVITKTGKGLGGNATTAYGSYDTKKATTSFGGATGHATYEMYTGYLESDGFRDNSHTEAQDIGANWHLTPNERWKVQFSGGYHKDDTHLPGALMASDLDAGTEWTDSVVSSDRTKLEDYYVQAGLEKVVLSNDLFILETAYRNRSMHYTRSFADDAPNIAGNDSNIDTTAFSLAPQIIFRGDFNGVSNRMAVGYDLIQLWRGYSSYLDYTASGAPVATAYKGKNEKQTSSFFIHDELGIGDKWILSGGYRLERATYRFQKSAMGERVIDDESYTAGIAYRFGDHARWYGSYTHGFRLPTLDELYDYRTATTDADLQAQTFSDYEIGLSTRMGRHLKFSADVFQIRTKDEIIEDTASATFDNLDWDTLRQGLELTADWQYRGWTFGGGYTYMETKFESGPYKGNEIPNVPNDRAFGHISYTSSQGLLIGLECVYMGNRRLVGDWNNDAQRLEDFLLLNAKVQYSWRRLTVFVDLNNILNKQYAAYGDLSNSGEAGFYPAPEFNFLAGVSINYGRTK